MTTNRQQLQLEHEAVKAEIRSLAHSGDHELLNLLRIESFQLRMKIGQCPNLPIAQPIAPAGL
jgi:hypothetical protein